MLRLLVGVVGLLLVVVVEGCASAPQFRAVAPPMTDDQHVELGVGTHGILGPIVSTPQLAGGGLDGWVVVPLMPNLDITARGHGAALFALPKSGVTNTSLWGGSAGLRGHFNITDTLLGGGEAMIDYQQQGDFNTGVRYVSGIVGAPFAEKAFDNFYVYTELLLGLAIPVYPGSKVPFFGFSEFPLGVAWKLNDSLVLQAEGGASIPFNGAYFGVAAAFRL
jgi:hypothetical protein